MCEHSGRDWLICAVCELAELKPKYIELENKYNELRMRVQETIMSAETETDKDGWITAYHFKTGLLHKLLADVRS